MIEKGMKKFFESEAGQASLVKAINTALEREITFERTDPTGRVEIVKEKHNLLDVMAAWLKNTEGALRGCQADAAAARNKATQARDMLMELPREMARIAAVNDKLLIAEVCDEDI